MSLLWALFLPLSIDSAGIEIDFGYCFMRKRYQQISRRVKESPLRDICYLDNHDNDDEAPALHTDRNPCHLSVGNRSPTSTFPFPMTYLLNKTLSLDGSESLCSKIRDTISESPVKR